jgi:hypothetical protein
VTGESALHDWVRRAKPVLDQAFANLASDWRRSTETIDFGHADADEVALRLGPLLAELDDLFGSSEQVQS